MTAKPMRIMVVEDDATLAKRLAAEIHGCGHCVVGPFDDIHEALQMAGTVQAAILDVTAQTESCFWVADALHHRDVPFVFLTEARSDAIPARFGGHHSYSRHRHAAPLLDDLHRQRQNLCPDDDDSIDSVVIRMMHHSRRIMPDERSAERLVEATLQRAVAQRSPGTDAQDMGQWLLRLLGQEYRLRGRSHLH